MNPEFLGNVFEYLTLARRAVSEAQQSSLEMGVANVYSKNGSIYYQMPNGTLTTNREDIIAPFLKHQGYEFDFSRDIYFNRIRKTIISRSWAEDHIEDLFKAATAKNDDPKVWFNDVGGGVNIKELIGRYLS